MSDESGNEAELGRDGELPDESIILTELDQVLRAEMLVGLALNEICPGLGCPNQDPSFISESNRSFGLVF